MIDGAKARCQGCTKPSCSHEATDNRLEKDAARIAGLIADDTVTDFERMYYQDHLTPERIEERKAGIAERVKVRQNDFYDRFMDKIKKLKHKDVEKISEPVVVDTRTKYEIALDEKAADILANDPDHQQYIVDREYRRLLNLDATSYHNYLMHSFWEIKKLGDIGVPEPRKGDPRKKARYDEWVAGGKSDAAKREGERKLKKARDKLDNVFEDNQKLRRIKSGG